MSQVITIKHQDILHQVKISGQIPQIIEGIVTRKIIETAVAEVGLEIQTEELQQAAALMRAMKQLRAPEPTWAWLAKFSLSLDDFEKLVYTNLSSSKLAQHLFGDQVESYFFSHQLDYAAAAMYEIVLEDEGLGMELFDALSEGEIGFLDVAHQYIRDRDLARCGGYRGVVRGQEMKPEISAAVLAAKPPQLLKPIITSEGVHLILVEEIVPAQLDEKQRSEILSHLFKSWLQRKIEEVEIVSDYSQEPHAQFFQKSI